MAKETVPESDDRQEESCEIIWSEPDPEGHRHFRGLDCDTKEARDRVADDIETGELIVSARSVKKR